MKFHDIEMVGKLIVEKVDGLPSYDSQRDKGRLVLDTSTNRINFGDSSGGKGVAQYVKHNFTASTVPTSADDENDGYEEGSVGIDQSASPREAYRCVDPTADNATGVNTSLEIGELGTLANQDKNSVDIDGGSITGINDLAVADGGTGASSASAARNNLGLGGLSYDSTTISLTGDFDSDQNMTATKVGNLVNITGNSALTHSLSATATPTSETGVLPVLYRPTNDIVDVYFADANGTYTIIVGSNGTISFSYRDNSGNLISDTTTQFAPSITYTIT